MKKMIVLVGLFMSAALSAEVVVTPMIDFVPQEEMGYVFDIKTSKFKNVTLDCQSFITGIIFEETDGKKYDFYLDMFQCEEAFNFFSTSKRDNISVCIGVDKDQNELFVTNDEAELCK